MEVQSRVIPAVVLSHRIGHLMVFRDDKFRFNNNKKPNEQDAMNFVDKNCEKFSL